MANLSGVRRLVDTVGGLSSLLTQQPAGDAVYAEALRQMQSEADPINDDIFKMSIDAWGTSSKKVGK